MAITNEDVRHIAALAKLGLTDEEAARLTGELGAVLAHMDVLSGVDTDGVQEAVGVGARGLPTRGDHGPPIPLERSIDSFAPQLGQGFFLVPRLASHDTSAGE